MWRSYPQCGNNAAADEQIYKTSYFLRDYKDGYVPERSESMQRCVEFLFEYIERL
jgi:hypothetical protein